MDRCRPEKEVSVVLLARGKVFGGRGGRLGDVGFGAGGGWDVGEWWRMFYERLEGKGVIHVENGYCSYARDWGQTNNLVIWPSAFHC